MKKIHKIQALALMWLFPTLLQAQALSKAACEKAQQEVVSEWYAAQKKACENNKWNKLIRHGDNILRYSTKIFGEKPVDGRSLWISLHGGGGCPPEVNDQQWENQKVLYQPAEGVYVAPRAPWDAWNMWCQEPIDALYEELIRTMVVYYDVNPNKVYLIGYSAGGDGVWREAPRLADHWAGCSMMAGHPGDVSLVNLRNMPYMIWCGAEDAAYDRNKLCKERGLQMDSLQQADAKTVGAWPKMNDRNGYIHEWHIMAGKGHWMDLEDKVALPWLAKHTRNPYPTYVVWQQEEVLRPHFYWLSAPAKELKRGKRVDVKIEGNTIELLRCDYNELTLSLNDQLVNLDKPVIITYNGKQLLKKKLTRSADTLHKTINERNDPSYAFPTQVSVQVR